MIDPISGTVTIGTLVITGKLALAIIAVVGYLKIHAIHIGVATVYEIVWGYFKGGRERALRAGATAGVKTEILEKVVDFLERRY